MADRPSRTLRRLPVGRAREGTFRTGRSVPRGREGGSGRRGSRPGLGLWAEGHRDGGVQQDNPRAPRWTPCPHPTPASSQAPRCGRGGAPAAPAAWRGSCSQAPPPAPTPPSGSSLECGCKGQGAGGLVWRVWPAEGLPVGRTESLERGALCPECTRPQGGGGLAPLSKLGPSSRGHPFPLTPPDSSHHRGTQRPSGTWGPSSGLTPQLRGRGFGALFLKWADFIGKTAFSLTH